MHFCVEIIRVTPLWKNCQQQKANTSTIRKIKDGLPLGRGALTCMLNINPMHVHETFPCMGTFDASF